MIFFFREYNAGKERERMVGKMWNSASKLFMFSSAIDIEFIVLHKVFLSLMGRILFMPCIHMSWYHILCADMMPFITIYH